MRDAESRPPVRRREPKPFWSRVMLFTALVLLVNGLIGERGLTELLRARRVYAANAADLGRLKRDNAALRARIRRLRSDPQAIEAVARGELGLLRPDEILITVKDVR